MSALSSSGPTGSGVGPLSGSGPTGSGVGSAVGSPMSTAGPSDVVTSPRDPERGAGAGLSKKGAQEPFPSERPPGAPLDPWTAFATTPERPPGLIRRATRRFFRSFIHEYALAIYGGLLLAVGLTWPTLRYPLHTLPEDLGDPARQAWQISWLGHILLTHPQQIWQSNAFYPEPNSLAFGDSLLGYAPAGMLGDGPLAATLRYNILFVLAHALLAIGGYALVRQLGAGRTGAAVAAVAIAYAPWRLAQEGHLDIVSAGGILLALAMLARGHGWSLRRGQRPKERNAGWAALGWLVAAWQVTLGFSLGLPFLGVLGLIVLILFFGTPVLWLRRRSRRRAYLRQSAADRAAMTPAQDGLPAAAQPVGGLPGTAQPTGGLPGTAQPTGGLPGTAQPTGGLPGTGQPVEGWLAGSQPVGNQAASAQIFEGTTARSQPLAGQTTSGQSPRTPIPGSQPVAAQPARDQPTSGQPAESQPSGGQLITGQAAESQPITGRPAGSKPLEGETITGQPAEGQPTTGQPAGSQPPAGETIAGQPAGNQPLEGETIAAQPAGSQPLDSETITGQPAEGQPTTGQPAGSQPPAGETIAAQPAGNQPLEGETIAGQPAGGQPTTGQPAGGQPPEDETIAGRPEGVRPTEVQPAHGQGPESRATAGQVVPSEPWVGRPVTSRHSEASELPVGSHAPDNAVIQGQPTGLRPAEGKPAESKPAEERSVEDKPVEGTATDDKAVDDKAVNDKAVNDKAGRRRAGRRRAGWRAGRRRAGKVRAVARERDFLPVLGWRLLIIDTLGPLILAGIAALVALPYFHLADKSNSTAEIKFFSPPVWSLLIAPSESRIWGAPHEVARSALRWPAEMSLLPGFVLYALALAGLWFSIWKFRQRLVLIIALAAAVILTLGTNFFGGRWTYLPLFGHLPASLGLRIPGRMMLWVTLLLGILAAGAVAEFVRRAEHWSAQRIPPWPAWWLRLATLVPLVLVIAEGWNTTAHPVVPAQPASMRTITSPMLVLPTGAVTDGTVMLWSTSRYQKIANGSGGFAAARQAQMRTAVAAFPDATSIQYLRSINVTTVLLIRSAAAGTPWERAGDTPVDSLGITREDTTDAVVFHLN